MSVSSVRNVEENSDLNGQIASNDYASRIVISWCLHVVSARSPIESCIAPRGVQHSSASEMPCRYSRHQIPHQVLLQKEIEYLHKA